ncbi:hypothetical protein [Runella sp.]|uniref:hypothetical protein n=1 Tax=Runella sp. TaxID=1960881 RepID=UPI003D0F8BDB
MKTKLVSIFFINYSLGIALNYIILIALLWGVWSSFYDQLTVITLLYVLIFSPIWIFPFSFFFTIARVLHFLLPKLSIDLRIFIASLITGLALLIILLNTSGLSSNITNQEEIQDNTNNVVPISLSIIYTMSTYLTYLILRKIWMKMFAP